MRLAHQFRGQKVKGHGYRRAGAYRVGRTRRSHCLLLLLLSDSSMRTTQVIKGEMSAKTTYQRSAKGPVSISECSADGKYVSLENTGRKVSTAAPSHGTFIARASQAVRGGGCYVPLSQCASRCTDVPCRRRHFFRFAQMLNGFR